MHSSICKTYLVSWCCIDIWSIRGGGGVSLPWVYVHSAIYETYFGVVVSHRSTVDWRRGLHGP